MRPKLNIKNFLKTQVAWEFLFLWLSTVNDEALSADPDQTA